MKQIALILLFVFFGFIASAQYSLLFCEDVDADGVPKMPATTFMVSDRGGMLRFFVRGEDGLNSDGLKYQIYLINESGNEESVAEFKQKVESWWNYVWKDVVFFQSGTYRVKVYDSKDAYLTSANVNIKTR